MKNLGAELRGIFDPNIILKVLAYPEVELRGMHERDSNLSFQYPEKWKAPLNSEAIKMNDPRPGAWPRDFYISPDGKYMLIAGARANEVQLFKIDAESGKLSGTDAKISVPVPTCILFVE